MKYTITQSRILYVLSINDRKHQGLLKVGEVFVDNEVTENPGKQVLAKAVREILDKRTYMQGVTYHLEFVECTTYNQHTKCYKADDVHRKLKEMGIASETHTKIDTFYKKMDADIWFHASLKEVRSAINQIKAGKGAGCGAIQFRPEQKKAIEETIRYFQKTDKKSFLWNAKMRFGKTLSGLEVAKQMGFKSTLIITHRPVVDKGWHDDFEKIFGNNHAYAYATRMSDDDATGGDFYSLTKAVDTGTKRLVFFVSMQYLRLSQYVGGKERHLDPLKRDIMKYDWDFVMVDEAHEGIEAAAGVRVMEKLKKENTRILSLSGTPFNLLDKYEEGAIFTWDYVMEQREKVKWDDEHFGDPNPYADLPRMQILTFTLPKILRDEAIENNETFKFHEFFRVWTEDDKKSIQRLIDNETNTLKRAELQAKLAEVHIDKFIHEGEVKHFLDKLVEESETSQYPFSTKEFRENFKHTFWLLPGVKEAAALKELLDQHEIFGTANGMFHIINAAGDGNIEDKDGSALAEVENNIHGNKAKNITKKEYTITLSCGKLTTGVSVPEWTAVLCMKGSENTPAANYMQTIFRVQTHAVLEGRQKSDCYVFDFAPDRALTAVAETAKMAVYAQSEKGKRQLKLTQKKEEEHLQAFIKLCPVISMDEGEMGKHFSASKIFEKLSNVYIERAVRSGYADNSLYNQEQLLNLTPEQEKALGNVHDLLGSMPASWKAEKITVNKNGLGDTDGADQIKYIFYLSTDKATPARPSMSDKYDDEGCPTSEDDNWSDVMCAPTQLFPYLFVSNSCLIEGSWTNFSQPVLWKQWIDKEKDTDDAKKKRDEENKEKRARMSVLRGVSIRIPLLVYGAEINDDAGEEITIDNFASDDIVDDASWEEFMPKGFTKQTFNILKDCFDRSIFTGAAKRIRQMVKEADTLNTEDRINKIATIFSYFHNPDKETVLTPWRVVNMHLSDTLGGWCFFNEEFDGNYTIESQYGETVNAAHFVDRGQVTKDVFGNYNARILEINSKTGLYPLYMAYSLFKTVKEPEWREFKLTGERGTSRDAEQYYRQAGNDLEIWKDVLQDNIFVVCRTKMAVSITKRTLAGFRQDVRMNIRCYEHEVPVTDLVKAGVLKAADENVTNEGKTYFFNGHESLNCDMINVLRAKPELFQNDIVRGNDFWHVYKPIPKSENEDINNMKFTAIVGNPPYQIMDGGAGASATPIYNLFVDSSKKLNPICISMITPSRWFAGGKGLDKYRDEMINDTRIKTIVNFLNGKECFPGASTGSISYFLWHGKYNGKCKFATVINGKYDYCDRQLNEFDVLLGNNTAISVIHKIQAKMDKSFSESVRPYMPFGLRSYVRGEDLPFDGCISLYSSAGVSYYKKSAIKEGTDIIDKYKVFTSKLLAEHAGEPDKTGRYKVLSRTEIIPPETAVTESYLILAASSSSLKIRNYYRYCCTKFFRFLLLQAMSSINMTKEVYKFVPLLDFSEEWTDQKLYDKYDLSDAERTYIENLIKPME